MDNSPDDFFVTLQSDLCKQYYSDNTSANFCNYLARPIDSFKNEYLCGVSEIFFSEADAVMLAPSSQQKFFNSSSQSEIVAIQQSNSIISFPKKEDSLVNFYDAWAVDLDSRQTQDPKIKYRAI